MASLWPRINNEHVNRKICPWLVRRTWRQMCEISNLTFLPLPCNWRSPSFIPEMADQVSLDWERKWTSRRRGDGLGNVPLDEASDSGEETETIDRIVIDMPSRRQSPRIYTPSPRSQSLLLNLAKDKASRKIDEYRKLSHKLLLGGAENLLLLPSEGQVRPWVSPINTLYGTYADED